MAKNPSIYSNLSFGESTDEESDCHSKPKKRKYINLTEKMQKGVSKKNIDCGDTLEFSNVSHIQKLNPVYIPNLKYINDVKL